MIVDQVLEEEEEELKLVDHLQMEKEEATELMLIVDQVTVGEEEEATEMNVVVDQVLMEEELKVTVIADQVLMSVEDATELTVIVDEVLEEE